MIPEERLERMKLRREQVKIVLPELFDVLSIIIEDHNGLLFTLRRIPSLEMKQIKEQFADIEGRPTVYTLESQTVTLHPRPDKDYDKVHIEYLPMKRVI
jgi:hypothetical protein